MKAYFHLTDAQVKALLMLNVAITIPTRIVVGSILAGVGLAATATGIVLATRRGGGDASSDTASLRLSVQPTGLSLRGSF